MAQALLQPDTPRNPSSGCSFAGPNNAFFVCFLSHSFPICSSIILKSPSLFPRPLHLYPWGLRSLYAVFAGFQLLLNTDIRQCLLHFLAFLRMVRKVGPPAGSVDLILRQLNKLPSALHSSSSILCCLAILLFFYPVQPAVGDPALAGGWTRWPTEVPSNPYHSVILWQNCKKRSHPA